MSDRPGSLRVMRKFMSCILETNSRESSWNKIHHDAMTFIKRPNRHRNSAKPIGWPNAKRDSSSIAEIAQPNCEASGTLPVTMRRTRSKPGFGPRINPLLVRPGHLDRFGLVRRVPGFSLLLGHLCPTNSLVALCQEHCAQRQKATSMARPPH